MPQSIDDLLRRHQVEDTVTRMFVSTDERDWPAVMACFTDPFTLDMTSMTGGSPASLSPGQVTEMWADGFKALDHVHHQVGNFQTVLQEDTAHVRCYGIAFHRRDGIAAPTKSRVFVGTYDMDLVGEPGIWRISTLKFNLKFVDGNLDLEKAE